MKFILGTKGPMLTVFAEDGRAYAATVINAEPSVVTQIKTKEKEGYNAVQIGAGSVRESRVNKAQLKHLHVALGGDVGRMEGRALKYFKETRQHDGTLPTDVEVGALIDVSVFVPGEKVAVSAVSKGKGFQGVIKRHGFHGGPRSHGQKHSERSPGSIGGGGGRAGGRVAKGMRMAGRMGQDRTTVRNLLVLQVIPETHELVLAGAVPGRRGTLVEVRG